MRKLDGDGSYGGIEIYNSIKQEKVLVFLRFLKIENSSVIKQIAFFIWILRLSSCGKRGEAVLRIYKNDGINYQEHDLNSLTRNAWVNLVNPASDELVLIAEKPTARLIFSKRRLMRKNVRVLKLKMILRLFLLIYRSC